MRVSYRLRVFLLLSGLVVAASVGWSVWRYASHAGEREAFEDAVGRLADQSSRIDSLEAVMDTLRKGLEADRERLDRAGERIGHFERGAVDGRLPTPQYREYRASIASQNALADRYNHRLARLQSIYAGYSALIDRHNALVDSANAMQRKAVEEGYQLPQEGLER